MTEFASLVLFSGRVKETVAFYKTLGVPLTDEDHDDGPVHYAADINGIHFAVYDAGERDIIAPAWRDPGSSFPGFYVDSLEAVEAALADARVLTGHQVRSWGCRIVVADPDGRPVEINQREHCRD